jgi:hypothetical protein
MNSMAGSFKGLKNDWFRRCSGRRIGRLAAGPTDNENA